MKISVICRNEFIKKNVMENLKNIRDGKNRTRTGLSISEVLDTPGGDTAIIIPGEDDVPDHEIVSAQKIIWVFSAVGGKDGETRAEELSKTRPGTYVYVCPEIIGKWDDSEELLPSLIRSAATGEPGPEYDPEKKTEVIFVEDMIEELYNALEGHPHWDGGKYCTFPVTFSFALGDAVKLMEGFKELNTTLYVPDMPENSLSYRLFSTYLSFLSKENMIYPVKMNRDNRGVFSELIKSKSNGQISVNIARPGITRGQHWHNTKWEIFMVVSGHGLIEERKIGSDEVISFEVRGEDMRAVIMLPGYTHSITNLSGDRDLVTVMYANEQFDPDRPDTFFEEVGKK